MDVTLADTLLREALGQGKQPFATIISDSMAPLLRRDDQVQTWTVDLPGLIRPRSLRNMK